MKVELFDFELPAERIALRPAAPRDSARLLVLDGDATRDRIVRDLPAELRAGDCLVFNDTRVIPAQLEGRRGEAKIGATLHKREGPRRWRAFVRNARRLRDGDSIDFGSGVTAIATDRGEDGSLALDFAGDEPVELLLERAGRMPLPPYIAAKRPTDARDADDYQTMFAAEPGAVAAPTAALHFTPDLIAALDAAGIGHETLTLHVGAGTFQPVRVEVLAEHDMHTEWYTVPQATVDAVGAAKAAGRAVVAVGTTSLRALESASQSGVLAAGSADTALFITPGYTFKTVTRLITNFHLPKSTLLMLVSAFAGYQPIRRAYAHAIASQYRFFSYGDAMLLTTGQHKNPDA